MNKKALINISQSAIERVKELRLKPQNRHKFLRVGVSSGGCSGFQYLFNLDDKTNEDDIKIYSENSDLIAVSDQTSLEFLQGCTIDFMRELGASYFKVLNPNAKNNCGCGSSFSI